MVERVAEAQWELARRHGRVSEPWKHVPDDIRSGAIELARAAIEAMREPTDDMPFPEPVKQYWRAMIDEALK